MKGKDKNEPLDLKDWFTQSARAVPVMIAAAVAGAALVLIMAWMARY